MLKYLRSTEVVKRLIRCLETLDHQTMTNIHSCRRQRRRKEEILRREVFMGRERKGDSGRVNTIKVLEVEDSTCPLKVQGRVVEL